MIYSTVPPDNLPLPIAIKKSRAFMVDAAKHFHAESWKLSNCKKIDPKTSVCIYSITVPKSAIHAHEICVGQIFVRKGKKTTLYRVNAIACHQIP